MENIIDGLLQGRKPPLQYTRGAAADELARGLHDRIALYHGGLDGPLNNNKGN